MSSVVKLSQPPSQCTMCGVKAAFVELSFVFGQLAFGAEYMPVKHK